MADEQNTQFNYLLNAFEHASQEKYPAKAGYAGKRRALLAHVRELERDAARYRLLRQQHWSDAPPLCVVMQPQQAVRLGYDCPSMERLDAAVDEAMAALGALGTSNDQPEETK